MAAVISNTASMIVESDKAATVVKSDKKQANKDLQKTRLCIYNLEGKCGYGKSCTFAHTASEVRNAPDLSKTQLCEKFEEGKCTNENCVYAHGFAELKDAPNFKKRLCKWHSKGSCRNGTGCGFAHGARQLRSDAPPGFEPLIVNVPQAPKAKEQKLLKHILPPPGLTKIGGDSDSDASTAVPSSMSQAESDQIALNSSPIPDEHLFRLMAGRGSTPLDHQVSLMSSAIGGLQAKLSQLEGMMMQNQVTQMQQNVDQLTEQCRVLEAGLCMAPQPTRSRLRAQAPAFKPAWGHDGMSEDSTSVGSE